MDHSKQLGEEKISTLLLRFSVPAIVGTLVNALYNIVDRIFVGNSEGYLGIAGITIGFPIMIVLMAFGMLIGIGSTSLISIRLGEKNKDEAEHIVGNALILLLTTALTLSIFSLIFIDPLLKLFGASQAVLPYAKSYLSIILFGNVFMAVGFGMNNFIRAEGHPKTAMFTMLIGAIINTILDPIFIFGFGWGIKGAAIATIISQMISAIWVLYHFMSGNSVLKIRFKNLKLNATIVKSILAIGMAPFSMQLAASLLNAIMNKSLTVYGGDIAISAMGIVNSVAMLILMPIIGITQGAQPIIGYNYGAEKYDRVRLTLKVAMIAATVVTTLGFIVTMLFPAQLVSLFNRKDIELIKFGSYAMRTFLLFLPLIGIQIVGSQYFQAIGKPKQSMILTLSRQVLILIPLLLILPRFFNINGILYAGPISDLLSAILTGVWLYKELDHLENKHMQTINLEQEPLI